MRMGMTNPTHLKRLLDHIKVVETHNDTPCWQWTGAVDNSKGTKYGKIKANGKTYRAHRLMAILVMRDAEVWEDVHHRCHNPLCINPDHLQIVDCQKHSRRPAPSNAYNASLPF